MRKLHDVLIVGAGIVGCSIAYELGKEKLSVLVVERGEIGREASWAAGGILSPIHPTSYPQALTNLCARGQADYPRVIDELKHFTDEDLEFRRIGMRVLIQDGEDRAFADTLEGWKKKQKQPVKREETGLFVPDVSEVHNPRLTRALAEAARKQGVQFQTGTEITGFLGSAKQVTGVRTTQGDLHAKTTVLAAGSWSGTLGITLPVRPVKGQMLLAQLPPDALPHMVLHKGHYLVPRPSGKILIGSTMEEVGFDKTVTVSATRELLKRALVMCPALAEAPLLDSWAGLRPATPDRLPYIGPSPDQDGLVVAAGHFRNGLLLGPITGVLIRDLLIDGKTEPLLDFRLGR